MSEPGPTQHDDRLSEELVAYLDGELSANESASVEARIQQDERARTELQRFDRVWNALDNLEQPTVGDSFTRTTIEMAAVEAKQELARETAMLPVRKRRRWVKAASLAAVAAVFGFAALAALMPNANRQLYANLPVIVELDAYSEVRDVEFLRLLEATSGDWLLGEWECDVAPRAAALVQLSSASFGERKKFVDELDSDARTDLASKHRRYQSMTPELRTELTDWHTRLAADPEAAQLQKVMLAYYAWVSQADELEQARLRSLDAVARVERVEQMRSRTERRSEWRLSPAETMAIREAVDQIATDPEIVKLHKQLQRSIPDDLPTDTPDRRIQGMRALKQSSPRMATFMVEMGSAFGGESPKPDHFREFRAAVEERLLAALDERVADQLRAASQRDRSRRLVAWLVMSARPQGKPDIATLEEFYLSGRLSEQQEERLMAMPRDEMLKALEQVYLEEFLGEDSLAREFRAMMQEFGGGRRGGEWDGRRDREGRWREGRGPRGPGPGGPPRERPPGEPRPEDGPPPPPPI